MENDNKTPDPPSNEVPLREGYQPATKGYQPTKGNLDPAKPPQGGSGVPPKDPADKNDTKNQ